MKLGDLKKEFPRESISWRAQTVTKDGHKAMALAYIDARDVMNRLDEVCGPESWQDTYEIVEQRTICKLMIRIGDYWVCKSDGAGETQVEGDKGAMSDAFKRAAVKWGIGRYLYDMPAPWVPCESVSGKFRKFTADPWKFVNGKGPVAMGPLNKTQLEAKLRVFAGQLMNVTDSGMLAGLQHEYEAELKQCREQHPAWWLGKGDPDHPGLEERITRLAEKFAQEEPTILGAG